MPDIAWFGLGFSLGVLVLAFFRAVRPGATRQECRKKALQLAADLDICRRTGWPCDRQAKDAATLARMLNDA